MAIIQRVDGLTVTVIQDPRNASLTIPEYDNPTDPARGQNRVKKYIEAKSDHDFGVRVCFDAFFVSTEDTHFRIDILLDGVHLCSDDVTSQKIRGGYDFTYLKANRGDIKEDFYFNPLILREDGEEAQNTNLGIINVQFHELSIDGFKKSKSRSPRESLEDPAVASKPYIPDFRKRPTHQCTTRPPGHSRRYGTKGMGYEPVPKPVFKLTNHGEGALYLFTFVCRSRAMLREMRLIGLSRVDQEARRRRQQQVRAQASKLPGTKTEEIEDDILLVSWKQKPTKNTAASRTKVRKEMSSMAKKAADKDAARRKRTKTFQKARKQAEAKRYKSTSSTPASTSNEPGFLDGDFVVVSDGEGNFHDTENEFADGDPGPSGQKPLFVSQDVDSGIEAETH